MKRLPDWRSRLFAVIQNSNRPFEWGENDCALFAARCAEAVLGIDYAEGWRGTYSDMDGAMAALAAHGYTDLPSLLIGILGAEAEIHPSRARRGDLVLIQTESALGWSIGVFDHERIGVLTLQGYGTEDRSKATRAFKVGE